MNNLATIKNQIRSIQKPLRGKGSLKPLYDRIDNAHIVLLGEASHGTSEFYGWRAEITKNLILRKGFKFIGVEADWPDCYRINRYIKGYDDTYQSAEEVLRTFNRFPTWMWANEEMAELIEWLKEYNTTLPEDERVGCYGLDMYSLWESMEAVTSYLQKNDQAYALEAKKAYRCFDTYGGDSDQYAWTTALTPQSCEQSVVDVLREIRRKSPHYDTDGSESAFNAEQNALIAVNAERYYRTLLKGGNTAWNIREEHMMDTFERLMTLHGADSKAIIWAHNSHVGDARYTSMVEKDLVSVGQLIRERMRALGVYIVGFATYQGSVTAAFDWDMPMRTMEVPPAIEGSVDELLHKAGDADKLLLFDREGVSDALFEPRGQRAIGVVYNPLREYGNYVSTIMPKRYDALMYIEHSHALHPIHMARKVNREYPETYPSAV